MAATLRLTHRIFTMPFPWNIWVMIMALVNVVGGLYFVRTVEGIFALATMSGAFLVMVVIFARLGFVRLLGLGHILFWPPLVGWFSWLLVTSNASGLYRAWLLAVISVNALSLIIDVLDVARYVRGERKPLDSPHPVSARAD